jgi:hypothetical protein
MFYHEITPNIILVGFPNAAETMKLASASDFPLTSAAV